MKHGRQKSCEWPFFIFVFPYNSEKHHLSFFFSCYERCNVPDPCLKLPIGQHGSSNLMLETFLICVYQFLRLWTSLPPFRCHRALLCRNSNTTIWTFTSVDICENHAFLLTNITLGPKHMRFCRHTYKCVSFDWFFQRSTRLYFTWEAFPHHSLPVCIWFRLVLLQICMPL